jgi:hypothetical protein
MQGNMAELQEVSLIALRLAACSLIPPYSSAAATQSINSTADTASNTLSSTAATTIDSPDTAATTTADNSDNSSANSDATAAGGDFVGSIVSANTGDTQCINSSSGGNRSVLHGSSSINSDTAAHDATATSTTDSNIKFVAHSSSSTNSSSSNSSANRDSTTASNNISSSISELDSVVLSGMQAAQLTMSDTTALQQHGIAMVASHELLEGQVIAKVLGALKASLGSASRYATQNSSY